MRGRSALRKQCRILGYGERVNHQITDPCPDITQTGHSVAGRKALAQAGLRPSDIRMFHPYDDFLIAVLIQFEQIGFCEPGEGSRFVLDHDLSYTGDLPLNTGGGQISAGQAGLAGGAHNFVEATRQLFGVAGKRQVRNADERDGDGDRHDPLREKLVDERGDDPGSRELTDASPSSLTAASRPDGILRAVLGSGPPTETGHPVLSGTRGSTSTIRVRSASTPASATSSGVRSAAKGSSMP